MKQFLTLSILGLLLSNCSPFHTAEYGKIDRTKPHPFLLKDLPDGNDLFSHGFRDACNSLIGATGYGANRMFDGAPNPEFITEKHYMNGYSEGARYCSVYVNKWITL